jgi:hypothetical protein
MRTPREECWVRHTSLALALPDTVAATTVRSTTPKRLQMAKRDENQKPGVDKPEGQHGDKTHEAFIESIHGKHGGSEESEGSPQRNGVNDLPIEGHHRLHEDRQQHDEAEKNSEANRLRR